MAISVHESLLHKVKYLMHTSYSQYFKTFHKKQSIKHTEFEKVNKFSGSFFNQVLGIRARSHLPKFIILTNLAFDEKICATFQPRYSAKSDKNAN